MFYSNYCGNLLLLYVKTITHYDIEHRIIRKAWTSLLVINWSRAIVNKQMCSQTSYVDFFHNDSLVTEGNQQGF